MTKPKSIRPTKQKRSPTKSLEMPKFTKAPSTPVETFRRVVTELPEVQPRQTFGYPAAFANTEMFASLFQEKMIVRLSDADRDALAREGAQPFEPMLELEGRAVEGNRLGDLAIVSE